MILKFNLKLYNSGLHFILNYRFILQSSYTEALNKLGVTYHCIREGSIFLCPSQVPWPPEYELEWCRYVCGARCHYTQSTPADEAFLVGWHTHDTPENIQNNYKVQCRNQHWHSTKSEKFIDFRVWWFSKVSFQVVSHYTLLIYLKYYIELFVVVSLLLFKWGEQNIIFHCSSFWFSVFANFNHLQFDPFLLDTF